MQLNIPLCDISANNDLSTEEGFFAEEGYCIIRQAIPQAMVESLAEWTKKSFWDGSGNLLHGRMQDEWKRVPIVKEMAVYEPILERLNRFYGRKPIPFQTLSFPVGTQQRTHSDTIHFHCFPQRFMCGVWVAFEEINADNGPLHYYPKSHRLPVLEAHDVGISAANILSKSSEENAQHYVKYENAVEEMIQAAGLEKKIVELQPGDALIWAANLLHGGEPIHKQGATRMSQVTHYYFEGCSFYTPLYSDLPSEFIRFRPAVVDISTGERINQSVGQTSKDTIFDGFKTGVKVTTLRTKRVIERFL